MHKNQEFYPQLAENGMFLLCVPAGWETYISREFYELQQGLVGYGWTKLVIGEVKDAAVAMLQSFSARG
ncbi:hypothetical protein [Mycoavidus sp. SF9855]|uniref:hypothetical protein n=1 Tax=Mycoavidus sp. SF9855 TaxID=2968475 RepID=UPI00211C50A0|nr:hypothetical protein [Mycoavidus sp. SF9855]UUM22217.1 hypothetical protein NQD60_03840 [Mycoavidus sp. SF9855]